MESSCKIPPLATPTTGPLILIFFFEKNVKYSISHCYITFYENYININFTSWYQILYHFLNKIKGGTLMIFFKIDKDGYNSQINSFHHFFNKKWKYSILYCFITFYRNYININATLWFPIVLHLFDKIRGVPLSFFLNF